MPSAWKANSSSYLSIMVTRAERKALADQADALLTQPRPDPLTEVQSIMDEVCERIANGQSLRHICESEHLPTTTTIKRWLRENDAFRTQYAQAREDQAEYYADLIVEIADTEPDAATARTRIDARKWVASKLLPKVYGDSQKLELAGSIDVRSWLSSLGESD